jgi:hypothetical protein
VKPTLNWENATAEQIEASGAYLNESGEDVKVKPKAESKPKAKPKASRRQKPKEPRVSPEYRGSHAGISAGIKSPGEKGSAEP